MPGANSRWRYAFKKWVLVIELKPCNNGRQWRPCFDLQGFARLLITLWWILMQSHHCRAPEPRRHSTKYPSVIKVTLTPSPVLEEDVSLSFDLSHSQSETVCYLMFTTCFCTKSKPVCYEKDYKCHEYNRRNPCCVSLVLQELLINLISISTHLYTPVMHSSTAHLCISLHLFGMFRNSLITFFLSLSFFPYVYLSESFPKWNSCILALDQRLSHC